MKREKPASAYPLAWPRGWPRTEPGKRERARFDTTVPRALSFVQEEVRRLGGKSLVISSNFTLGVSSPEDPGVCVYFDYQGASAGIPCDRWLKVEDNLHAIGKTIEAMRGIERWGAKHMVKAAFQGFAALPAPGDTTGRPWHEVLGVSAEASSTEVDTAHRRLRSKYHPDKPGGNAHLFREVQGAYEQAQQAIGARG